MNVHSGGELDHTHVLPSAYQGVQRRVVHDASRELSGDLIDANDTVLVSDDRAHAFVVLRFLGEIGEVELSGYVSTIHDDTVRRVPLLMHVERAQIDYDTQVPVLFLLDFHDGTVRWRQDDFVRCFHSRSVGYAIEVEQHHHRAHYESKMLLSYVCKC